MRKLIASLLLTTAVLSAATPAHVWLRRVQDIQFLVSPDSVAKLPAIELSSADVLRILSSYNVKQQDDPIFCGYAYGMTNPSLSTIDICSKPDIAKRELTLLHELFHVRYGEIGIDTGGPFEPQIDALAHEAFAKIFGQQPAQGPKTP